jgi:hypothetical protein
MPSQGFEKLVERALSDEAFAARLKTDPDAVIAEYGLSPDEQQALRSGDPAQMEAVGADQRVSKAVRAIP